MDRRSRTLVALLPIVLSASVIGFARDKNPLDIEDGILDEIHLKVATLAAGLPVVMRPFSTEGVALGTGGENAKNEKRSEAAIAMTKMAPDLLLEAFKSGIAQAQTFGGFLPSDTATLPANALVIEGRFTSINPGSKAKRYWASFGAGKSGVQVTGTVKDASGTVLAEFTHMRNSGIGFGGGDYFKFLSDDTKDVGLDLAAFLAKWSAGGDLSRK